MSQISISLPSALFPFRVTDLPRFSYGRYELDNVFRTITPQQQQDCVELWLAHGVLVSPRAAWERSRQVFYLIRDSEGGRLAGLNTLYPDRLGQDGPLCFVNRMFIGPEYRDSRLMIVATAATLCYAKTHLSAEGIAGIVNVNENPKLDRPGMRRIFSRLGYRYQGRQAGRDVWYFDFSNVAFLDQTS